MGFLINLLLKKWPQARKYEFWLKLMTDLFYMGITLVIFLYLRDAVGIESTCHAALNLSQLGNLSNVTFIELPP